MPTIIIYSKDICPYCDKAKLLLEQKGASYQEIKVDQDPQALQTMLERSQRRTVPQIFINDHHIGGFDDLWALEQAGGLDPLLQGDDDSHNQE